MKRKSKIMAVAMLPLEGLTFVTQGSGGEGLTSNRGECPKRLFSKESRNLKETYEQEYVPAQPHHKS